MYSFNNNFLKREKEEQRTHGKYRKNINMIDKHNHIKVTLNINNLNTPTERLHKNSR